MPKPSSNSPAASPTAETTAPFTRGDSKKKLVEDARRNRFKGRGKDLERGVSKPSLFTGEGPAPPMPLNEDEVVTVGQGLGHQFVKKNYFQATYCHYCSELVWGIKGPGYCCEGSLTEKASKFKE